MSMDPSPKNSDVIEKSIEKEIRANELIEGINDRSEAEKIELVKIWAWHIKHIKNPSERVQLISVSCDPYIIIYIENPTKKVLKHVIKAGINYLPKDISNLIELMKEEPILAQGYSSFEVQMAAVSQDLSVAKMLIRPHEKVIEFVEKIESITRIHEI